MSALFEDGLPTAAPARNPHRDVIDTYHAIIAEERARNYRKTIRYNVHYGYQQQKTQPFQTFPEALAFYMAQWTPNLPAWDEPQLHGLGADETSDGLTELEREAVELAKGGC